MKLRDKNKKTVDPKKIEAIPNPIVEYTNIIIGFEYDFGTATVYDISGRQLQHFEIKDRTVPVLFSSYPEGIYIVKVVTNKAEASVKVIKSLN